MYMDRFQPCQRSQRVQSLGARPLRTQGAWTLEGSAPIARTPPWACISGERTRDQMLEMELANYKDAMIVAHSQIETLQDTCQILEAKLAQHKNDAAGILAMNAERRWADEQRRRLQEHILELYRADAARAREAFSANTRGPQDRVQVLEAERRELQALEMELAKYKARAAKVHVLDAEHQSAVTQNRALQDRVQTLETELHLLATELDEERRKKTSQLREEEGTLKYTQDALERSKKAEEEKNKLIKQLQRQLDAYDRERVVTQSRALQERVWELEAELDKHKVDAAGVELVQESERRELQDRVRTLQAELDKERRKKTSQLREEEGTLKYTQDALERSKKAEEEKNKLIKQLQRQLDAYDRERAR